MQASDWEGTAGEIYSWPFPRLPLAPCQLQATVTYRTGNDKFCSISVRVKAASSQEYKTLPLAPTLKLQDL